MAEQFRAPTGTVSFLFTDIEGSTRSWEDHPEAMDAALSRHDEILRGAIAANGGYIFSTAGDAFAAAFERAREAIDAGTAAQQALAEEPWPEPVTISVRMGVHTGEAFERSGNYFGPAVNRAARLMSAGHGGQLLVSMVAAELVDDQTLVELGEFRLKDLSTAERIWQVGEQSFDPLRTLTTPPHNLPAPRTQLVSREAEIARVCGAMAEHRLVTLSGLGGIGKTRLALAAATELVDQFGDGVYLVELASVTDGANVAKKVADATGHTLGGTLGSAVLVDEVARRLADRDLLLVLDNCEHLIDDVAEFIDILLDAGERCSVLTTSRERLELDGEWVVGVPPLGPESGTELLLSRLDESDTDLDRFDDRDSIVEICRQLDGIPLALEFAAAQLIQLSPAELLRQLEHRFDLLSGGRRGRRRHQTLAAMMDWSWSLLSPSEQRVLAACSVFVGGFTADALATVTGEEAEHRVLPILLTLRSKSLIVSDADRSGSRFDLLETVRLYAAQKLVELGDAEACRDGQLHWALDFARALEQGIHTEEEPRWVERVDRELANIVSAAEWALTARRYDELVELLQRVETEFFLRLRSELGPVVHRAAERLRDEDDPRLGLIVATYFRLGFAAPVAPNELLASFPGIDWDAIVAQYPPARLLLASAAVADGDARRGSDLVSPLPGELRERGAVGEAARIEATVALYGNAAGDAEAGELARRAVANCERDAGPGSTAVAMLWAAASRPTPAEQVEYAARAGVLAERTASMLVTTAAHVRIALAKSVDPDVPDDEAFSAIMIALDSNSRILSSAQQWNSALVSALALAHRGWQEGVIEIWAAVEQLAHKPGLWPTARETVGELEQVVRRSLGDDETDRRAAEGRGWDSLQALAALKQSTKRALEASP